MKLKNVTIGLILGALICFTIAWNLSNSIHFDNNFARKIIMEFGDNDTANIKSIPLRRQAYLASYESISLEADIVDVEYILNDNDSLVVEPQGEIIFNNSNKITPNPFDFNITTTEKTCKIELKLKPDMQGSCQNENYTLKIFIPQKFKGSVETNSVSSGIKMGSCNLTNLNLQSVSGDISLDSVRTGKMQLETVSGSIEIKNSSYGEAQINSVSGSANMLASVGGLEFKSVSGDLTFSAKNIKNRISAETTSGNIDLEVPAKVFNIDAKTVSGSINIGQDLNIIPGLTTDLEPGNTLKYQRDNADFSLVLETTSGDIDIGKVK